MATIKTDRVDFEKLLNGLDPVNTAKLTEAPSEASIPTTGTAGVVDSTTAAETMGAKMFSFDYDSIKKGLRKKARKTVLGIIKHIIPDDIMEEEYIQDKIEQDIETLTDLYMQAENNRIMQRSLIESVNSGNVMPRMYEVFAQLTEKALSINKQIVDTEQRIRKTYIDLKFEIRDRQGENFAIGGTNENNLIAPTSNGVLVSSTKSMIEAAQQLKKQAYIEAKETKVEIIR